VSAPEECGFGISLEGGTGNAIEGNIVLRFHQAGIRAASFEEFGGPPTVGNTISRNVVRGAAVDGVIVRVDGLRHAGGAETSRSARATTASTSTTRRPHCEANVAVRNDDLGIEAVPGVTDGGGNHAAANGNPTQCTNVAC
jgi:hypothetical protein